MTFDLQKTLKDHPPPMWVKAGGGVQGSLDNETASCQDTKNRASITRGSHWLFHGLLAQKPRRREPMLRTTGQENKRINATSLVETTAGLSSHGAAGSSSVRLKKEPPQREL